MILRYQKFINQITIHFPAALFCVQRLPSTIYERWDHVVVIIFRGGSGCVRLQVSQLRTIPKVFSCTLRSSTFAIAHRHALHFTTCLTLLSDTLAYTAVSHTELRPLFSPCRRTNATHTAVSHLLVCKDVRSIFCPGGDAMPNLAHVRDTHLMKFEEFAPLVHSVPHRRSVCSLPSTSVRLDEGD